MIFLCIVIQFYSCWNDVVMHYYKILFSMIKYDEITFFCIVEQFCSMRSDMLKWHSFCIVIWFYSMRSNMLNWHSFALLYDFIEWDQMCWNYILLHISFSILDPIQMEPFLRLTTDTESWASKSWILAVVKWSLTTYGELTPLLDACSQMHL